MALTAPFPLNDQIADPQSFRITKGWIYWLTSLVTALNSSPTRLKRQTVNTQTAAIATTSIPSGALAAGLYRVSWYARVTQPATTSSSLQITIAFTDGGVTCTVSGDAMTSNTINVVQGESVLIRIDASTPITYSTAYSSVGVQAMTYDLEVLLEEVAVVGA